MEKRTLVIMAAGLGSRYGGNKQVDGIGPHGEILMQYSIYDAIKAGFNKIVFIIKPQHKSIIEAFCKDIKDAEICFAYQEFSSVPSFYTVPDSRVKPFGTVHAVLCVKDVVNEPFAVINADDFYGREAFFAMKSALDRLCGGMGAMVAYRLENTVSANGSVTRGICEIENGRLSKVRETYSITVGEDGRIYDSEFGELDGGLPASMNMWGFTPEVFDAMAASFEDFLRSIAEGDVKAEYALPTFVDKAVLAGELSVEVLTTSAVWFGVTYAEDKKKVSEALSAKHASGEYPERLF